LIRANAYKRRQESVKKCADVLVNRRIRGFDQMVQPLKALSHVDMLVVEEDAMDAGGAQA